MSYSQLNIYYCFVNLASFLLCVIFAPHAILASIITSTQGNSCLSLCGHLQQLCSLGSQLASVGVNATFNA